MVDYRYGYDAEGKIVITAVYIDDLLRNKTYRGYAMRSLDDEEDREKGERIALGRAKAAAKKGNRTLWSKQNQKRAERMGLTPWVYMCYVHDYSGFRDSSLEQLRPIQKQEKPSCIDRDLYLAMKSGYILMHNDHITVKGEKGKEWNLKLL